jgi:hypothetical protein
MEGFYKMKPVNFKQVNKNLLKPEGMTEDECGSLPVYNDGQTCISCWQPSLRERISILLFGKIWLWVHSGNTQPPVAIEGLKTIFKKSR